MARTCRTKKANPAGLLTLQLVALYDERETVHSSLATMARERYDRYTRIMALNKGLEAGVYAVGTPVDVERAMTRYDESVALIVDELKDRASAVERKLDGLAARVRNGRAQ